MKPTDWRRGLSDERGAVLFVAVLAMLVLSITMVAFMTVARDEVQIAQNDREGMRALYAGEAGANHGRWLLNQRVAVDLPQRVAATARATLIAALNGGTYSGAAGAARLIEDFAQPAGGPASFVRCNTISEGCPEPVWASSGGTGTGEIADTTQTVLRLVTVDPAYTLRVIVTPAPGVLPAITNGGQGALFTYTWRVEADGYASRDPVTLNPLGRATQRVSQDSVAPGRSSGQFTVALNASFVQYAHFIDNMDATQAWISFRHVYTGPVHTNTRFNILGNAPTAGQEGPTFRAEATQTLADVRFNNGGAASTQARDSTLLKDWPILGEAPGVLCKSVDCPGFTRSLDYDPNTPGLQPIPFPGGANPADRVTLFRVALGPTFCPSPCNVIPPALPVTYPPATYPVLVGNTGGVGAAGTLDGGVFVQTAVLDLRLAATANGQTLQIFTPSTGAQFPPAGNCGGVNCASNRRTTIAENRGANTITVNRECWRRPTGGTCGTTTGTGTIGWNQDNTGGAVNQTLTGLLSPGLTTDYGVVFVNANSIGSPASLNGLRRDPTAGVTAAIEQNTRLTVSADGNVYVTGHLNYQVDPRGPDGVFSPEDAVSTDDLMTVQNVLGIVSWAFGAAGGVHLSSALNGDLQTQGMIMAPNISGAAAPSGQFSFDDPTGAYRGIDHILGGVVQKTMGTFGSPGTPGTGYAREWTYDERFRRRGLAPPAFPGFPTFTANAEPGIAIHSWRGSR